LVVIGISRRLLSNRQSSRRLAATLKLRLFERRVRLAMMASSCRSRSIKFWTRKKSATEIWRTNWTILVPKRMSLDYDDGGAAGVPNAGPRERPSHDAYGWPSALTTCQ